jgi:uncharacterized SAM-binding protein YcdF (DUF218 family)
MFVFLSKLLPIFIYPLGLAIGLLVAALLLGRSPRGMRICVLSGLGILLLSGNAWIPSILTRNLEWQYLPPETYPQAEVIVVLGGSTASAQYPRQIVEISSAGDRILYAAHLYHQGVAPNLLLTGGYIPWMDKREAPANDMAEILGMLGVPKDALWYESDSRNTYENARFTKHILAEKGIDRIILVTSAMHMPRAVALFEKQGVDVIPAPADYNITQADWDHLWEPNLTTQLFNLLPSVGNLSATTSALKEYIGILAYNLRGWI